MVTLLLTSLVALDNLAFSRYLDHSNSIFPVQHRFPWSVSKTNASTKTGTSILKCPTVFICERYTVYPAQMRNLMNMLFIFVLWIYFISRTWWGPCRSQQVQRTTRELMFKYPYDVSTAPVGMRREIFALISDRISQGTFAFRRGQTVLLNAYVNSSSFGNCLVLMSQPLSSSLPLWLVACTYKEPN